MGIKLMVEVLDDAPDSLTFRERYVLLALAENFNDGTRQGWPAYDGDEERSKRFRRRARCSRAQFYETLKSLTAKGAIEVVVRGQKGRQAVYRIPRLADAFSVPKTETLTGVPETLPDTLPGGLPEASARAHGGLTESAQCPGNPNPEADSVSRFSEFSVPESGTPTPQVPSWLNTLNAANAAREGWGVWGEGSATEATDADSQPVAASADAPAWDGLRPRGFAAPATNNDQSGIDDEPQPPPVAGVLKNAATGEPSQWPGVGDLVPRQIHKAQQAYEPPAKAARPPRWREDQAAQRDEEWSRAVSALLGIDDDELNRLETAMLRADLRAVSQGRAEATQMLSKQERGEESEAARMRRQRLYGLIYALRLRPLASWPADVLPPALCGPESEEAA